jgi:hypothetical protein
MKIKATKKLLSLSRIEEKKDDAPSIDEMPGEWYASIVSTNRPGKLAIHFLHSPSYVSIIIPGKSLNKALPLLPERISLFLKRNHFSELESLFQTVTPNEVFANDNRSITGHLNSTKYLIEYHLALAESYESIDFENIEDIMSRYLFGSIAKYGRYISSIKILGMLKDKTASV